MRNIKKRIEVNFQLFLLWSLVGYSLFREIIIIKINGSLVSRVKKYCIKLINNLPSFKYTHKTKDQPYTFLNFTIFS
jgi:hypothetical protein